MLRSLVQADPPLGFPHGGMPRVEDVSDALSETLEGVIAEVEGEAHSSPRCSGVRQA